MRDVSIIGIGQVPIGDLWDKPIYFLAVEAMLAALQDATSNRSTACTSATCCPARCPGKISCPCWQPTKWACAASKPSRSKRHARRAARLFGKRYLAVASGLVNFALVCGVEKMTRSPRRRNHRGTGQRVGCGLGIGRGRYVCRHQCALDAALHVRIRRAAQDFAPFPINAHHNAVNNPNAMMHYELTQAIFDKARMIADPINLLDCSPVCDGAAAMSCARPRSRGNSARTPSECEPAPSPPTVWRCTIDTICWRWKRWAYRRRRRLLRPS